MADHRPPIHDEAVYDRFVDWRCQEDTPGLWAEHGFWRCHRERGHEGEHEAPSVNHRFTADKWVRWPAKKLLKKKQLKRKQEQPPEEPAPFTIPFAITADAEAVLEHLRKTRPHTITQQVARRALGVKNLAAAIHVLRSNCWAILTRFHVDGSVYHYELIKRTPCDRAKSDGECLYFRPDHGDCVHRRLLTGREQRERGLT